MKAFIRILRQFEVLTITLLFTATAQAGPAEFSAEVDHATIPQDESVSLKLSVQQEGSAESVSDPQIHAPDFDQLTSYQSQSVQSYYDNGHYGMKTSIQVTVVLRPKKTGSLKISNIAVKVGSQDLRAPDITVQVTAGGAGTAPPRGYGGGFGLQGGGKRREGRPFFLRTEVSKDKVYRGEQVIVSYYLYRRVRVFNVQPTQYPILNGFLREDLDIPVISQKFTNEPVVLDGVAYDRTLLARYAAYPLQEGKLTLDSMTIQANYYGENSMPGMDEDDDPFHQFFQRLAPRADTQKSEQVGVEVSPLPESGKPAEFSGVVGEFEVKGAVDKTEVKAGDPVTLTVVIEGRGNLASMKEPRNSWPAGVDLYEAKAHSKASSGGVNEKVFEFLLIPRNAGEVILPPLEFNFFNPATKSYEVKKTELVRIQVTPGAPGIEPPVIGSGAAPINPAPGGAQSISQGPPRISGLLPPGSLSSGKSKTPVFWWIYVFGLLGAGAFGGFAWFRIRKGSTSLNKPESVAFSTRWARLNERAAEVSKEATWPQVFQTYQDIEDLLLEEIGQIFDLPARSLSRLEIERQVQAHPRWNPNWWNRCRVQLEFSETVRFSGSDRAFQERASQELPKRASDCRALAAELRGVKS